MSEINKAIDRIESGNPNLLQAIRDAFGYKNREIRNVTQQPALKATSTMDGSQATVTVDQDGDFSEFFGTGNFDGITSIEQDGGGNMSGLSAGSKFTYDANTDKSSITFSPFFSYDGPVFVKGNKDESHPLDYDHITEMINIVPITRTSQLFLAISVASLKGIDYRIANILKLVNTAPNAPYTQGGSLGIDWVITQEILDAVNALPGKYSKIKRVFYEALEE